MNHGYTVKPEPIDPAKSSGPNSALPWSLDDTASDMATLQNSTHNIGDIYELADALYVIHACNLYPRLVECLRDCLQLGNFGDTTLAAATATGARALLIECEKGESSADTQP